MSFISSLAARRLALYQRVLSTRGSHTAIQDIAVANKWKNLTIFVCIPAIVLCSIHVALQEEEERPEFVAYEHLRIRRTKFPWRDGVKTLFHNPHKNALPDGYEEGH